MQTKFLTILVFASSLIGCAGVPQKPYWENTEWINAMVNTIQHKLRYPIKAMEQNNPAGHALVQFTYEAGNISDVVIIKSTGYQILDTAIATQMRGMWLPWVKGAGTEIPHRFQIPIEMISSDRSTFYIEISDDIRKHVHYPHASIARGDQGIVIARFQYRNGNILNPAIVQSSGSRALDGSVIDALSKLNAPPTPPWARDKTLSFRVPIIFCSLKKPCTTPVYHYVSNEIVETPASVLCSDVGFRYRNGAIYEVHLIRSSGDTELDKVALSQISKGAFPPPPKEMQNKDTNFEIPVCYDGKQIAVPQDTTKRPLQG